MKAVVLMLAFLGIVSAGKLGHHHHSAGHGQSRPGRLNPSSGTGQSGPTLGQGVGPSPGQFGGQGQRPSPGQFGGQGQRPSPGQFGGQVVGPSPGQFGGQGQLPSSGQFGGQGQRPSSGQFGGQGQRPSSGQFGGQGQGPSPGQFGGQGVAPSSGQFGGQGQRPSSGQFGGQGVGTIPGLGQAVGPSSGLALGEQPHLLDLSLTGIATFDNHACVFRNGELRVLGPILNVGETGDFEVQSGTATLGTGQTVSVDNGLVNLLVLESTDTQALQVSLARAGITLDQFIQQTETLPPQQGVFVVTAGAISINGILKNIRAGVFLSVGRQVVDPNTGDVRPIGDTQSIGTEPAVNPVDVQTVTVTETAAHETVIVTEPVILTKTQTQDEFVTITSPLYNSRAVTITNIVKQTVTVPEEQVIRSPVAGSIVVNTIPVSTQTVMTVSVRSTNMFVRTVTAIVTDEHAHFVTNYSISTATVNNPVTSTVVQTITQTSVSTVFNTSTVGSTIYTTTTATINIGTAGATQTSTAPGGYY